MSQMYLVACTTIPEIAFFCEEKKSLRHVYWYRKEGRKLTIRKQSKNNNRLGESFLNNL